VCQLCQVRAYNIFCNLRGDERMYKDFNMDGSFTFVLVEEKKEHLSWQIGVSVVLR